MKERKVPEYVSHMSKTMISLCGGHRHDSINLTNDEVKSICKVYGFKNRDKEVFATVDRVVAFNLAGQDGLRQDGGRVRNRG